MLFDEAVGGEFLHATAALHNLVHKLGYQDVVLDFSETQRLWPEFMVPLVTMCRLYRQEHVDFQIVEPQDPQAARILSNTNWAHIIQPEKFESKSAYNKNHLSVRQYFTPDEHHDAVDASLELILHKARGIDHDRLKALEWALNEICDNVLNHAQSPIGGIMQVVTFPARERVEFFVADAGITIPRSLRQSYPELGGDSEALRAAVEEGVTRDKVTNQGNGLYGTFRCCEVSGGAFEIVTGMVSLKFKPGRHGRDLVVRRNAIPFSGTYVRASIGYDYDRLLEEALVFKGKRHNPSYGYVERIYQPSGETIHFDVGGEVKSFGTRASGAAARTKVENLMNGYTTPVEFDFGSVRLISSSFADEVFGKLFEALGPIRFSQLCHFKNVDSTVQGLIDRAIAQRLRLT
jgi:anti-sigma regulatory factor (Ser/Thr protein kinase)